MDSQKLANVRTAVYTLAAGIGGFFVARGIITQAQLDSYLPIVVTVIGLILAIVNVAPGKPVTEPHPDVVDSLARLEDSTARVEDSIAQLTDAPAPAAGPAPQVTPGDHADPAAANELLAKLDELSKQ